MCAFEPEAARAGAVSRHAARRPLQPAPCNLLSCPESNADSGEESEEYFDLTDDDDVSSFRHVGTQTGCAPPPPCVLPQPALQQQPTKKRRIRLNGLASYTVRAPPSVVFSSRFIPGTAVYLGLRFPNIRILCAKRR